MTTLPNGYRWAEPLNGGAPLGLDWPKDGDEWIDFVMRQMVEGTGATGFQMIAAEGLAGGHVYRLSGAPLPTALWVRFPTGQGPVCAVLGEAEPPEDQIARWRDAVVGALGAIGTVSAFGWWAVIGPSPDSHHGAALRLSSAAVIGRMRLDPADGVYGEGVTTPFNIFSSHRRYGGLVKVRGTSTGHTWSVAEEDAARRLRLLCALLSISSRDAWIQRSPASPLSGIDEDEPDDGETIKLPTRSPWDREELMDREPNVRVITEELPGWISRGWDAATADPALQTALVNHHEGLLLRTSHPSYALVAFVAVVESLGNRTVKKLPRCKECHLITESGQRFRAALARVIPDDEAKTIGRRLYDLRSRTAHDGVLHGSEPLFGAWTYWAGISANATREFESLLDGLSTVARRLLLLDVAKVDVPRTSLNLGPPRASRIGASTSLRPTS